MACRGAATRLMRSTISFPLSIGGSDDDANLWPEPRRMIEPEWSAERKDELEMRLHALVCAGRIDIVDAQKAIAEDWTERYVHFVSCWEIPFD